MPAMLIVDVLFFVKLIVLVFFDKVNKLIHSNGFFRDGDFLKQPVRDFIFIN